MHSFPGLEDSIPPVQGLLRLPENTRGRDFFVGDIQGCLQLSEQLLDAVRFDPAQDRLISVGDLVDRGPDSQGVLRLAMSSPWLTSVLGNHEVIAAQCLLGLDDADPLSDQAWTASWPRKEIEQAVEFLLSRPIALEVPIGNLKVGVVHAEMPQGSSWSDLESSLLSWNDIETAFIDRSLMASLLWGRRRIHQLSGLMRKGIPENQWTADDIPVPVPGIDLIVAGHTVLRLHDFKPACIPGHLWLDTGAGYRDAWLTMVNIRDGNYIQTRMGGQPVAGSITELKTLVSTP